MKPFMRDVRALLPVAALFLLVSSGCGGDRSSPRGTQSSPADTSQGVEVADWCAGHGVPESMCTLCNPELIPKFKEAGDWCAEHGLPESVCPTCNPGQPRAGAAPEALIAPGTRIRFRSPDIERAAGIRVARADRAEMAAGVECAARIDFDRNRAADIRAPFPGVIREVLVDLGERVEAGDPLFVIESPQVGDLQARVLAARQRLEVARADHERHAELRASDLVSARDLDLVRQEMETARAELDAAEASVRIIGGQIETGGGNAGGRYALRAPVAGVIARRPAMTGTFADEQTSLATVADLRVMWAVLELPEMDAAFVRLGQPVTVAVDGIPDRRFTGKITWIAAEVDPKTRTVDARAEIPNQGGMLRAQQFATAVLETAPLEDAVAVPAGAVQRLADDSVVFVRTGAGVYEPRSVTAIRRGVGMVQVAGNVRIGDEVVTDGAYLLRTELSRESIGAGCCEVTKGGER